MDCDVTYEQLAALAAGDLSDVVADQISGHVETCRQCRDRLTALARADAVLAGLRPERPSAEAVVSVRRGLAEAIRSAEPAEIMTLDEVAEFLRVTPEQLGEVIEELPGFELAGQVRFRRTRLIEWVEQRERDYTRKATESWAARYAADPFGKGVA